MARGDVVVADRDGVVVLPANQFDTILASARGRLQKEEEFLARIRAGELTLDIYGFSRTGNPAH